MSPAAERLPIKRRCDRCGAPYPAALLQVVDDEIAKSVEGLITRKHVLRLSEEDRQLVLLALAVLSLQSPGFDHVVLNGIALRVDNEKAGRGEMYEAFREARRDITVPAMEAIGEYFGAKSEAAPARCIHDCEHCRRNGVINEHLAPEPVRG